MKRLCVIDLPGFSRDLLSAVPAESPLAGWLGRQRIASLDPSFPALTCSVQATLTTGTPPSEHGIIANGMATYRSAEDQALVDPANHAEHRCQVSFWEQSNQLLQRNRFWQDENGQSRWKTAMLFFQNAMPGFTADPKPAADIVITPKPEHGPNGETISLVWTNPRDLEARLTAELGPFPLMHYWGPLANLKSSQWIIQSAIAVWQNYQPQLQLVYIPHLDYDLQRFGPASPQAKQAVVDISHALTPLLETLRNDGAQILLLSEYAMEEVNRAIAPNRLFAEAGLLKTHQTDDGIVIDYANTPLFAMVDHQIAHIYANGEAALSQAARLLAEAGCDVLDRPKLAALQLDHRRSGDLVAVAPQGGWFDYRWWQDPSQAPAFATTVDIHRKPGYDPLELFFDPATRQIIQDETRIRGSHGRKVAADAFIAGPETILPVDRVKMTDIAGIAQRCLQADS